MKTVFFVCIISLLMLNNASAKSVNTATKVEVLAKSTKSWNGDQLPKYSTADPEITILKITIPAGTKLPLHQHNMINAGVLLKGQLTVVTEDNDTLHMKAGDTIVEVVNKWHYGKNDGLEPAEIIVFYAGTVGEPLSIKK